MVSAFLNTVKIPELRRRILFTLAVVVIVRLGAAITTPGVNQAVIQEWFRTSLTEKTGGSVAALFNLFSGGALENCAIFSLGIMPYISASIMMQLLTAVIPQLGRLAKEDGGRQKIMQYTRYATVCLCLVQGYLLAVSFQHPESYHTMLPGITETTAKLGIPLVDNLGVSFQIVTVISLTTGTLFLMWLGDQITERGIGNGISLIITIGIVARLPAALAQAWKTFVPSAETGTSQVNPAILVLMVAFLFIVIAAVIAVTQGVRKITVQYAKRVVGRKMYGGQTQYMPLKVNYAGVMPIIFAWALLLFPATIVSVLFKESRTARTIADMLSTGWLHYAVPAPRMIFSLQLFLGGDASFSRPKSRTISKIRRLSSSRRSPRPADRRVSRFHHDAAHFRGRVFSHVDRGLAESAQPGIACAGNHRAIFRRHQFADYRGRNTRHDAPGGDASYPAALRRIFAQGASARRAFRSRGLAAR